jgi:hypothetical protein
MAITEAGLALIRLVHSLILISALSGMPDKGLSSGRAGKADWARAPWAEQNRASTMNRGLTIAGVVVFPGFIAFIIDRKSSLA